MSGLKSFSTLLLFVLCLLYLQGFQRIGITGLVIFIAWAFITLLAYGNRVTSVLRQRRFLCLFVFLIFYFISSLPSVDLNSSFNRVVGLATIISPVLMYEIMKNEKRSIKSLFVILITGLLLIDVYLAFRFQELVGVTTMRDSEEFGSKYFIVEIAFNICYVLALIVPSYVELIKKRKVAGLKMPYSILLFSFVVLFSLFLLRAQFSTAILLALIGVAFSLFYNRKHLFRFVLFSSLALISFVVLLPSIIDFLEVGGDYQEVSYRLEEINNVFIGASGNSTDLNSRQDLTLMSLKTFINNPFFGVNYKLIDGVHVIQQGIGNHAEWADFFARYGLFAILLLYFMYDSLKRQKEEIGSSLIMVLFLLLGFLNPLLFFPQMVIAFLYLPILYQLLLSRDKHSFNLR